VHARRAATLQYFQQRLVKATGGVALRRRHELVVEAEVIKEGAQARIVVLAKARMCTERIGYLSQRLAEILFQELLVGHVVWHLAQAVHVVGEGDQPCLHLVVSEHTEGVAHHRGARHLSESADVRQAGRSVARLEDDLLLGALLQPCDDLPRLGKRPGVRLLSERAQGCCGFWHCKGHYESGVTKSNVEFKTG
jgi:hypothetical protein